MKKISTVFSRGENCDSGYYGEIRNFDIEVKNSDDDTAYKIINEIASEINSMINEEWDEGSAECIGCPSTYADNCGECYRDTIAVIVDECDSISRQMKDVARFYKIAKKKVLAKYNG